MMKHCCGTCRWMLQLNPGTQEAGSCTWQFSHLPCCVWQHRAVYADGGSSCPTWEGARQVEASVKKGA